MGAIAGAVSKDGNNVCYKVINMLKSMRHRGLDSALLFYNGGGYSNFSLKSVRFSESSTTAIGVNFRKGEGAIYSELTNFGINEKIIVSISKILLDLSKECQNEPLFDNPILENKEPKIAFQSIFFRISKQIQDSFEVVGKFQDEIIAFRDPIGIKPLFFSESDSTIAFASESKALMDIGMSYTKMVPIGEMITIDKNDFKLKPINRLIRPPILNINIKSLSNMLKGTLESTIKRLTFNGDVCAVAFSGGIDSTLIARIVESISVKPKVYVSGIEDCQDISSANYVASKLDYDCSVISLSINELERRVDEVLKIIMDPNPMLINIGLPLFSTAEAVRSDGFDSLFLGQGADELFGGYSRYCKILGNEGTENLEQALWNDLLKVHKADLLRDDLLCMANSVTPLYPYLNLNVVNIASRIPIEFKVAGSDDELRKRVLRIVAKMYDLPDEIVNRKKKAVQFGSGVTKAIKKIARKNGFNNSSEYLSDRYEKIRG